MPTNLGSWGAGAGLGLENRERSSPHLCNFTVQPSEGMVRERWFFFLILLLNHKIILYLSSLDFLFQKQVFSSSKDLRILNSFKLQSISRLLHEKYYWSTELRFIINKINPKQQCFSNSLASWECLRLVVDDSHLVKASDKWMNTCITTPLKEICKNNVQH